MGYGKGTTGASLNGRIFYSKRAMKKRRNANKQFHEHVKEMSGPCYSRKVSPQEMEAIRCEYIAPTVTIDFDLGF